MRACAVNPNESRIFFIAPTGRQFGAAKSTPGQWAISSIRILLCTTILLAGDLANSVDPRGCRWAGTKNSSIEEFFDLLPVGKSSM